MDITDYLPTMAEAIGASVERFAPTDGHSFWKRLTGQGGSPRPWLFTWYFPRPYAKTHDGAYKHPMARFVHDGKRQLFDDGRLVDLLTGKLIEGSAPDLEQALRSMPSRNPNIP